MGIEERKQREFERRERDLLDAALALFDDDNWDQVTVAEIAKRAEIGKGTVYKHFPSKDEIYARLSLEFGQCVFTKLADFDPTATPTQAVRSIIHRGLRHHFDNPQYTRVVRYTGRRDFRARLADETRTAFATLDLQFVELIAGVLERGMAGGAFARKPVGDHILALTAEVDLLIAPAYAWIYHLTGDPVYQVRGDKAFAGGVKGAWLDGGKMFTQSYRWSFDYVKWRTAPTAQASAPSKDAPEAFFRAGMIDSTTILCRAGRGSGWQYLQPRAASELFSAHRANPDFPFGNIFRNSGAEYLPPLYFLSGG